MIVHQVKLISVHSGAKVLLVGEELLVLLLSLFESILEQVGI